jgi:hypothetical protein
VFASQPRRAPSSPPSRNIAEGFDTPDLQAAKTLLDAL